MITSANCAVCMGDKAATLPSGQTTYVYGLMYSNTPVVRVFCSNCGITYAPESISCVQAQGVPS